MKTIRNPIMVLIPKSDYSKLVKAGYRNMRPIVKLFVENITWLVTGIEDGILYGYGDLGMGCVEWGGLIHESELPGFKGRFAYLERDIHFKDSPEVNWLEKESLAGC